MSSFKTVDKRENTCSATADDGWSNGSTARSLKMVTDFHALPACSSQVQQLCSHPSSFGC